MKTRLWPWRRDPAGIPAGTPMPTPVPDGKWGEYAACISEGFCPSCRQPLRNAQLLAAGVTWAQCWGCECRWELNRRGPAPQIGWRGTVGDVSWDIWVNDADRVFGQAEWAE